MKQPNTFAADMLNLDTLPDGSVWIALKPVCVTEENGSILITVPFQKTDMQATQLEELKSPDTVEHILKVESYGSNIIRMRLFCDKERYDAQQMLHMHEDLKKENLTSRQTDTGWDIVDLKNSTRMTINTQMRPTKKWSDQHPPPPHAFNATIFPDGETPVTIYGEDHFFFQQLESIGLGYVEQQGTIVKTLFSLHAHPNECFAGTGERFSKMDLAGSTYLLENQDGLGVNSRRAYKNIPFFLSSRLYGLLTFTSAHVKLSLADISTRAAQGSVEDNRLDLFIIGGKSPEQILRNYRRLSGFPADVPSWSYGVWMSRMTYFSADEINTIARRIRDEKFPCDVLHIDTGWFNVDWKCEWEFNKERFPNPEQFIKEMEDQGFKISLWQFPCVLKNTIHEKEAVVKGYVVGQLLDHPLHEGFICNIDFTNPEAYAWYQKLLKNLIDKGAKVIKTDFAEDIVMDADYAELSPELLHNLYPLLYQKAAFESATKITDGLIWARSAWTGSQRYPVHWGGDCASTWDGLAGTIKGGLHIGVSGFGFWSHDVGGFHGIPDFMNHPPEEDLYLRWTQVGTFTSHMRYHGTSPREFWEYPNVAPIVREWLHLRYALIPYLIEQGKKVTQTGYPFFRALLFHHPDDPMCWQIDNQFYAGDSFLVAPILNAEGKRDVYLPEGDWIDFWTGEQLTGGKYLKNVTHNLNTIPVFVPLNHTIKVYPHIVQHTEQMDWNKVREIKFENTYNGLSNSILKDIVKL